VVWFPIPGREWNLVPRKERAVTNAIPTLDVKTILFQRAMEALILNAFLWRKKKQSKENAMIMIQKISSAQS